jgi:hypothetical protein
LENFQFIDRQVQLAKSGLSFKIRTKIFVSSDAFVEFVDFLQTSGNKSDPKPSVLEFLNSTDQVEWFLSNLNGAWAGFWMAPFQLILTKWGFCFTFNLSPLAGFLQADR